VQLQQPGGGATDHGRQPLIGQADLLALVDAAGDRPQRRLDALDRIGQAGIVRAEPGAGGHQHRSGAAVQLLPHRCRRGDQQPLSWLIAAVRASGGTAAGRPRCPDRLHDAVASLGRGGGRAGKDSPGGGFGVDRIRLAALAAGPPVGPVDLHDVDPRSSSNLVRPAP
jgi:hypothetical protein